MAALLEWGSIWFEEYWDSVKLVGSAHGNEQLAWSLNLEASRTVPFWERWNGQPAPGKPGSLIKKIECAEVDEHLLAQVRVANPQEQIEQGDVKDTMAVSTWFLAGKGKFHAKNLVRKITERASQNAP
ncbi:hypothetical protein IW138_006537 [Coemansia sp. RSA 986]|nr:hypothetical protein IW138_006537 [Coemansia sp. RSA 986]